MITKKLKMEFAQMYASMIRNQIIEHNEFAIGNFAYFVDRCLSQSSNMHIYQKVLNLVNSRKLENVQSLLLLIASHIYMQAQKDHIGENLKYRMRRIKEKYEKGQLNHFEVLLDDYDFPAWYLRYQPYIKENDTRKLHQLLVDIVRGKYTFEAEMKNEDYVMKTYLFINRVANNSLKWQYLLPLIDAYFDEDMDTIQLLWAFKLPLPR